MQRFIPLHPQIIVKKWMAWIAHGLWCMSDVMYEFSMKLLIMVPCGTVPVRMAISGSIETLTCRCGHHTDIDIYRQTRKQPRCASHRSEIRNMIKEKKHELAWHTVVPFSSAELYSIFQLNVSQPITWLFWFTLTALKSQRLTRA